MSAPQPPEWWPKPTPRTVEDEVRTAIGTFERSIAAGVDPEAPIMSTRQVLALLKGLL